MIARLLAALAAASAIATLRLTRAYLVEGDSMRPTLRDGDYVTGLRLPAPLRDRLLRPNAIVVARRPDRPQLPVIKRLAQRRPNGDLWLLGDHPALSTDSRQFGAVPPDAIEALVWLRYWPPRGTRLLAGPFRPSHPDGWIDHVP